ncbi:MAG: 2-amino-4-hydroxy-6-hydroxymethyldihydropteridine diphosphokinase [Thauera sp.]|jgi:2-amino-4-hydroxy-6-hydroxymethyldihydropteridine diphosphokinase|nr:2-amino-4-hydroxy-6-hydroxymethyldihydropteridine diphosphokinase [Thauera sp.]
MKPVQHVRSFVAFGANLGDPRSAYRMARRQLAALPGTRVVAHSALYRSAPIGVDNQPDFLNGVIELATTMAPHPLLHALLGIEHDAGRRRNGTVAPRTIDLDLLLHGDQVIHSQDLQLPHPRMHLRAFTLLPLTEIAPDVHIPGFGPACALLPGVADQQISRS